MTGTGAAFIFLYVAFIIVVLSLITRVLLWVMKRDRMGEEEGLANLDGLRWNGWTPAMGWPPMTCWPECRDFHRADWWRMYLDRTCAPGCETFHRADWWKAYLEQARLEQTSLDQGGAPGHEVPAARPVSVEGRRPGRRRWAGRPVLLSRTAVRDRGASEGIPLYGGTADLPSGRT
jgi:hypothetical protein